MSDIQTHKSIQFDMDGPSTPALDERLQIIGRIFQSVGISAVIWGADALTHHAISSVKTVLLPLRFETNGREMI
jgi:hypothetical protein